MLMHHMQVSGLTEVMDMLPFSDRVCSIDVWCECGGGCLDGGVLHYGSCWRKEGEKRSSERIWRWMLENDCTKVGVIRADEFCRRRWIVGVDRAATTGLICIQPLSLGRHTTELETFSLSVLGSYRP